MNHGYILVHLLYGGILVSCEELGVNLISGIKNSVDTSQSSIYDNNPSPSAIDGKASQLIDTCKCCSVTDGATPSWWQINLGNKYLIHALEVFGRQKGNPQQLQYAAIYAGNVSLASSNTNGVHVYTIPKLINDNSHFIEYLQPAIIAQYFKIGLDQRYLTLCEFKLYEKFCGVGRFGAGCSHQCHCSDQHTCNSVTGICQTPECLDGWQGPACDQICGQGTFGYNCSSQCYCKDATDCEHNTGFCSDGCAPGWRGQSCDTVCGHGTFGYNCSSECHCNDAADCDHNTGFCSGGCAPGWRGQSCDTVCGHGTFGYNCSSQCYCKDAADCEPKEGFCSDGCAPGWRGQSCDTVCGHGTFGYNCSSECYCKDDADCEPNTGFCSDGCAPGWQEQSCDTVCSQHMFGPGCNTTCHCLNSSHCDPVNGTCDTSQCDPGWQGLSCSNALLKSPEQPTPVGGIVGGVLGAILMIVIAVVIGLFLMKRRAANKQHESKSFSNIHTEKVVFAKEEHINERVGGKEGHINVCLDDDKTIHCNTDESDYYHFDKSQTGIRIPELWDYINKHKGNQCVELFNEFKTLPHGLVHEHKVAANPINKRKNRYKEIYAYDHSRVILDVEGDKETDYINACYIDGFDKIKMFVASQGATNDMIDDFWRMVWQLKSDKIVMLTNVTEMGTIKCLHYWPEKDECSYGSVHIKILEIETFPDYNIRHLEVSKDAEMPRRIRQFHFKSWPDKDVPDSTWCLVSFWRAVETDDVTNAGPIIVHCSAGIGRTGTFIALDNMVKQAKAEGCVRPLQIVETLRRQRLNMVQTKDQYVFLHEVLADSLLFGTHFIWTTQFENMYNIMMLKEKGDSETRLKTQFSLILKSLQSGQSEATESAEYSNMDAIFSESDAYRPKLKKMGCRFVQELDAIYIPDYKGKNIFLLARSPDKRTNDEFWSLVDNCNIKTIIMLTESSSPCYQTSCDLGASAVGGNRFSVNKIEENINSGFTQRSYTFKESDVEDGEYLATTKQFEYTAWKDGAGVPGDTRSLLDFIEAIQEWQPNLSDNQPILIHCGDGCSRSGIICVILNELQRMKHEGGHINIVESVKMMKQRQRQLINSYEQYKFCYDLILAYIKNTEIYQNVSDSHDYFNGT